MLKQNQPMKLILAIALVAAILASSALIGGDVTLAGTGTIDRLGGADRYATSALIAGEKYSSSSYCIVTRGDVYADGLAASTLAGALDAPILLTRPDTLPASVSSRIRSLGYPKVIILGGTSAVSTKIENSLKSLVGTNKVQRIGGSDRFDTAARIARRAKEYYLPSYAFILNGWASADSLVAGPSAFKNKAPIL
ncbi:MAG TPA: cell wall-binding repeat-containing protein [Firmicutes bacterium]|nr:cell wall-binding repeat-containing protein [Bacillota bacterium]